MLHRRISTIAKTGQTKHWLFEDLLHLSCSNNVGEGQKTDVQLVAICNLSDKCE